MISRIIGYGCSYTCGVELTDHLVLNITRNECDILKQKTQHADFYKNLYKKTNLKKIDLIEKEKQESWLNKLAKKVNIPVVNNASEGNSMTNIFFEIIKDFYNNNIKQDDLILVGIPPWQRYTIFDLDKFKPLQIANDPTLSVPFARFFINSPSKDAIEFFYKDVLLIFNHYQSIINCKNLLKNYHFYIQNMVPDNKYNFIDIDGNTFDKVLWLKEYLVKNISKDLFLDHDYSLEISRDFINDPKDRCGYGHMPPEAHEALSNSLSQKIIEKFFNS